MRALIKEKGISATAAAEELGFRNRTAFFRILHDESRMPSIKRCFEAAAASTMLALTQEEIARLKNAMRVSELGKQEYLRYHMLTRMAHPKPEYEGTLEATIEGLEDIRTVEALLEHVAAEGEMHVVLMGRCGRRVLDRMHRLTKESNVTKIVHFFAVDEDNPQEMEIFADISPILFSKVYAARCLNDTGKGLKNWWMRSGVILLFPGMDKRKKRSVIQLTWLRRGHYFAFQDASGGLEEFWTRLIEDMWEKTQPLKMEQEEIEGALDLERYGMFTDAFRQLEHNRAIYMIKPDFPINCVPADMLLPVIMDGMKSLPFEWGAELTQQLYALKKIHQERVKNLYEKKKVTHIVLNAAAMMNFARTGHRLDHFFLGRPYTPEERVRLLTILRDQTRDNPYFNLWFGRNPGLVSDREVTVYDGYGLAMIKADTSWHLESDHQEIMIPNTMLAADFKAYFLKGVLVSEVMTKEESLALLEEMIRTAGEQ